LAFKTLESSFKPPEHSFKCVGLSRIPHSYNNCGKMAVKRLTIRYSVAAVVVALAIIGTSLYVSPIANAYTNFAVMLTDPPVVPDGTTKLEVKYSYVQAHVVASDGTDHWEDSQDGGTVDLLSLVGVSQTIGNLDIKTGSTVDRIKFTITGAKATINGQVYPVTILSEQLIINLTKVKLDGINTGALIDLRPVLHEIKAIDANGDPVSYYVLVPSATAVVKKNVSEEHKKVGAKHDLTDEEEEELEDEYENASKDVSIEDADLVVNGADTVLTLVIKNNGPENVVIHGITIHGDFTFSSPAQSSHSKENDHPRTIPFEVGSDGKLVPRMSGGDDHHDDGKGLELLPGETKTLSFSGKIQIQPNDHGKSSPITISFIDGYDYTIRVSGEGSQTKTVKANAP